MQTLFLRSSISWPDFRKYVYLFFAVIEDSIRGHMGETTSAPQIRGQPKIQLPPGPVEKDLGGLACPRTKSPPSGGGTAFRRDEAMPPRGSRLNADGTERRENQMSMDYPTMEIPQSSRFSSEVPPFNQHQSSSYLDKRNIIERHPQATAGASSHPSTSQPAGPPPSHMGHRKSYGDPWQQHTSASAKTTHPPEAHNASPSLPYRFDGAAYPPPPPSHSVGRELSGRSQDPRDPVQSPLPPRKRMTPPQHSHPNLQHHAQLPLKKQALEGPALHPDAYGRSRGKLL